ncbi:LOW QUALITY PROTEIN: pleckstrin homology domain-containing family B member 2 [Trichechus inunguis]
MAFVKSGWLLRQSTILKRWEKNFDLWSDGHLIYYDDQTQTVVDEIHTPVDCTNIRMGHECWDIQPPDGNSKDCMLQIVCRDGKTVNLCAESTDDCFFDSIVVTEHTLQDFSPFQFVEQTYGFGPYNGAYPPGTHIVYTATRQAYAVPFQYPYAGLRGLQLANQVIIGGCYRANDSDVALGMLAGAATGMASGSLFWVL